MSLLDNGPETVTFVLADQSIDSETNVLWRPGQRTRTIGGVSLTPRTSSGSATEGQNETATFTGQCRAIPDAGREELFYGRVLWRDEIWEFESMPEFHSRTSGGFTDHVSFSLRKVADRAESDQP